MIEKGAIGDCDLSWIVLRKLFNQTTFDIRRFEYSQTKNKNNPLSPFEPKYFALDENISAFRYSALYD